MTLDEFMQVLAAKASATTRKTLMRHGAPEPVFGAHIGDMEPIAKQIRGDQDLALKLYATGNSDAMYLAGLVADGRKMTRAQIERWEKSSTWHMHSGCTVPSAAAEHPDAIDMALKWIDSPKELIVVSGWVTLAAAVAIPPDEKLPVEQLTALLDRVVKTVQLSANRVR